MGIVLWGMWTVLDGHCIIYGGCRQFLDGYCIIYGKGVIQDITESLSDEFFLILCILRYQYVVNPQPSPPITHPHPSSLTPPSIVYPFHLHPIPHPQTHPLPPNLTLTLTPTPTMWHGYFIAPTVRSWLKLQICGLLKCLIWPGYLFIWWYVQ